MEKETPGIYRRVLSGFAWQGTSKILVQAISWISTVVVARLLEPSDYGVMAIAGVFLVFMLMLTDMGLSQALVQQSTVTEEEEDAVFWLSFSIGSGLFLLLYLAAPAIADFYGIPLLTSVLRVCAFGLVISSLKTVPQAVLMRRLDFRSRALVEVWGSLISMGTVLTLALNGYGVWSLAWGTLVQQTVVTAGFLSVMKRLPRFSLHFARVSGIVRFGLHLLGANMAYVVSRGADVFIIGKVLGQHLSGIYSLAFQLATMPLDKIGTVFNQVAFPSLARVKDNDKQCRDLFKELHRYLLFIAYPTLIGLAVVAEDLVAVLLGAKWAQVVPVLQMLCIVNVVRVSGMLISPALTSRGHALQAMRYSVAGAILLPLCFLAGVQFGLQGVALAWIVGYPLLYGMLLRYLYRDLAITLTELISDSRPTLVATTVMAASVLLSQEMSAFVDHVTRLVVSVGVGALAYIAVFVIFYGEQVARMRRALRALRSGSSA